MEYSAVNILFILLYMIYITVCATVYLNACTCALKKLLFTLSSCEIAYSTVSFHIKKTCMSFNPFILYIY